MTLADRQKSILQAVIETYIQTARPISSAEIARTSRWVLSPATIRNELLALDNLGYLEQPHTSAGRIPTDKGYRFFVDYLLTDAELEAKEEVLLRRAFSISDAEEFTVELAKAIARVSGAFVAAGTDEDGFFCESGFEEILTEPEFDDPERVRSFGRIADFLNQEIKIMLSRLDPDQERIWIGAENPWREARDYAMIVSSWEHPAGFHGFLSIISPTRTDYKKHKAIIEALPKTAPRKLS